MVAYILISALRLAAPPAERMYEPDEHLAERTEIDDPPPPTIAPLPRAEHSLDENPAGPAAGPRHKQRLRIVPDPAPQLDRRGHRERKRA
ncbi:hypothetical protein [Nocardia sp. NPDC057030]|uniref:hypothetical protein n=1 Tax=unclassified Nocardia TaxID=2637762 RepID=UPI00362F8678